MSLFERISARQKKDFTKNLAIMLKSGMPINDALFIVKEQANSDVFKKAVERVQERVIAGESFSHALEREEEYFGRISVSIIRAGENSGRLAENLLFLAEWFERSENLRRETQAAMLYPKIVIAVTLILGVVLSAFVLPRLLPLFDSLHVELPAATTFLINAISFTQTYWIAIAIGMIAFSVGVIFLNKVPSVRSVLHGLYLRLPVTGGLVKNYQLALLTQVLHSLLQGNISIDESLVITRDAATNMRFRDAIEDIRKRVQSGDSIAKSIARFPKLFPLTFTSIIDVGEKTGSLNDSVEHLKNHYSAEVSQLAKRIPQIIEPLLLVGIAIVVGFIAIAIITPLYEVTQGLT